MKIQERNQEPRNICINGEIPNIISSNTNRVQIDVRSRSEIENLTISYHEIDDQMLQSFCKEGWILFSDECIKLVQNATSWQV